MQADLTRNVLAEILIYTRILDGLGGWKGSIPMVSMRRLKQTLDNDDPIEAADIDAATAILQRASDTSKIDQMHVDALAIMAKDLISALTSQSETVCNVAQMQDRRDISPDLLSSAFAFNQHNECIVKNVFLDEIQPDDNQALFLTDPIWH